MGKNKADGRTSFGRKKVGVAKKRYNKHNPKPKEYRGQGR